jgi:hypothetical protein
MLLQTKKIDISKKDTFGKTAMDYCNQYNMIQQKKLLLEKI